MRKFIKQRRGSRAVVAEHYKVVRVRLVGKGPSYYPAETDAYIVADSSSPTGASAVVMLPTSARSLNEGPPPALDEPGGIYWSRAWLPFGRANDRRAWAIPRRSARRR